MKYIPLIHTAFALALAYLSIFKWSGGLLTAYPFQVWFGLVWLFFAGVSVGIVIGNQ